MPSLFPFLISVEEQRTKELTEIIHITCENLGVAYTFNLKYKYAKQKESDLGMYK